MLVRAWYFRRNHVDYLWRALKLTVRNVLRRPRILFEMFGRSQKPAAPIVVDAIPVATQAAA
jgi:hypothetical protein